MTGEDVLDFIKTGEVKGIKLGMSVTKVYEILGQPDVDTGGLKTGYLQYDIVSFGYFDDVIDEIAMLFYKTNKANFVTNENEFGEIETINSESKINEFIYLLNTRGISWDCYDKGNLDYFIVRSGTGVGVIFDLNDGTLYKISYTTNH